MLSWRCFAALTCQSCQESLSLTRHKQELASKCTAAEARANRLAQELAEYKEESSALRNQDLTIRRLEEKVRSLEAQVEEKVRST